MNSLNDAHNLRLFKDLSALRKGNTSVLWAMIRGRHSEARIALLLGWTPALVKKALHHCSDAGMVNRSEEKPDMWYMEKSHENFDRWQEMKALSVELELEIVEAYPRSNIEPGYLSSPAQRRLDPAKMKEIKAELPKYLLRQAQWRNLQAAREAFAFDQIFSTTEYQRARKTSNTQYSVNELIGLCRLGMALRVEKPGRGLYWKLTREAFDYEHVPLTVGEVAARIKAVGSTESAPDGTADQYLSLLANSGAEGMTTRAISEARGISRSAAHKGMCRLLEQDRVALDVLTDGINVWKLK